MTNLWDFEMHHFCGGKELTHAIGKKILYSFDSGIVGEYSGSDIGLGLEVVYI